MKRFLRRLLAFIALSTFVMLIGMSIPLVTPHQNLHYALIDKHKLLESIAPPRIILVGGSNLSFGIDSERLSKAFDMPVINTSINAGMGLKYIVEDIIPYLKDGDIVILSPEYDHFYGDALWGNEPMISSVWAIPSNARLINFHNWKDLLIAVPKQSLKNIAKYVVNTGRKLTNRSATGIYDRDSFNKFGDVTTHYEKPAEPFSSTDIDEDYNAEALVVIGNLQKSVKRKNGKLFVTFPALNKSSFVLFPQKIATVTEQLRMNRFDLLGSPTEYCFPDSLFFNAKYHLTKVGVERRTSILIDELKNSIQPVR